VRARFHAVLQGILAEIAYLRAFQGINPTHGESFGINTVQTNPVLIAGFIGYLNPGRAQAQSGLLPVDDSG